MDFRRINHFVATTELGSVTKTAKQLNIAQPALSQRIKRLESELGVSLFQRSKQGMKLTGAGQLFLKSADGILHQFNGVKESISKINQSSQGLISLAVIAACYLRLSRCQ